jgi:putative PIN family toxin of toxin-antitoxin system
MDYTVIIDTSVFVGALLRGSAGSNRSVLRLCLERRCNPIMGEKLFLEYESVLGRVDLFKDCPISAEERTEIFAGFFAVCRWVSVHYLWRPNLPDEGDNHLLELAVAGGADAIVTQNVRDFRLGQLQFPEIQILTPSEFLRKVV